MDIALLGFLPWTDKARGIEVRENPSALVAEAYANKLKERGVSALFLPVEVSAEGIIQARESLDRLRPSIALALGQTRGAPKVEAYGRAPGAWARARPGELTPWLLAEDADALAHLLADIDDPRAELESFRRSDDAGGYYCDHLCVELARWARKEKRQARFLHLTAIDNIPEEVAQARLRLYERQVAATLAWLSGGGDSFRLPNG